MIRTSLTIAALLGASATSAQTAAPVAAAPLAVDYTQDASWLCRPNRTGDACSADLTATSVAANGKLSTTDIKAAVSPKIDCFYVYPTVSTDPTPNSDMSIDAAERYVATVQFAPFRSVCRTFAPMYRQVTLSALRAVMTGQPTTADRLLAYNDVAAAWADYLKRDNGGRGVILIGHSQGSGVLKALIQQEIDGKPVAAKVIASYLLGTNIVVPTGKDVGGDFKATPLCKSSSQVGCIVTYVSFRADSPPPAGSRFARTTTAGMSVACTNPAALGGGKGVLRPRLPNGQSIASEQVAPTVWSKDAKITTPFVELPDLLSAECTTTDSASYLAVTTNAVPSDPRLDQIPGDVIAGGIILKDWGLHLIDVNEATGNLVALAGSQGAAYTAKH